MSGVMLGGPSSPITQIIDSQKTSSTPGTPVVLGSASPCTYVEVQALEGNANPVCVGGSSIVAAAGGTQKGTLLQNGESKTYYVTDLSQLYLDVRSSGDGVAISIGR